MTLSFTTSEAIATPTAVFKSNGGSNLTDTVTYTNTNSPNKTEWTAAYTAASGHGEGPVTYTIDFADLSGNAGTQATSGSGSVIFDNTVPTLSSSSPADNATGVSLNTNIALTFSEAITWTANNITVTPTGNTAINYANNASGVSKSGSPAPRPITSLPAALNSLAF